MKLSGERFRALLVAGFGLLLLSARVDAQGGYGTVNVALNTPVTVSSKYPTIQGNPASITNGSFTGSWYAYQGQPNYCSIVIDLGKVYSIGKIELDPLQVYDYQLYGSTDNVTYTPMASETFPYSVTGPVAEAINGASSARYIKYEAHATWNQYVGIGGLRVYEWLATAPAPQPASAYGTSNLAKGKTTSNASGYTSDTNNPPARAVDGDLTTAWYGTNAFYAKNSSPYDVYYTSGLISIDLGQVYKLGKVVITPARAQIYGAWFTQDSSDPSTTKGPVTFQFASNPKQFGTSNVTGSPVTFYLDGSFSARYVWLLAQNITPGGTPVYPGVSEVEVYEFAGTSTPPPASGNQITYNGFSSTAGLTLVGNAATASTSDGTVLRLTPAVSGQSGAAYSTTPVTLGNNATFSTRFQFRFTNPGGWDPADGITFVLGTSTTGLGGAGVGIGYQGVSGKSVAIEFDTYNNAGYGLGNDDGNSSNHVSIDTNGNLTNTALANVYGNASCGLSNGTPPQNSNTVAGCMSNGNLWTANISYDGSNLTVILSDPAEASTFTAINSYAINLASLLGQNTAYVGFTSGTGAGWENHDIVNWTFTNTGQSICTYALSPGSASPGAALTTGTVTVTAGTGCTWTSTSNAAWITITGGASGTGNGTVNYSVAANTGAARTGTVAIASQTFTVSQAAGGQTSGGTNLITNGDAESGPASGWDSAPQTIPGWTTDGNVAVVAYTDTGGDLSPTTPGPPSRGNNYFAGTPGDSGKMTQTIDVSSSAAAIDAGTQPYTLDGWLGGYDGQDDNAVVQATFQNASGAALGSATIGPVLSSDRGGVSELIEETKSGTLPAGTRKVLITVTFTRTSGSDDDGLADNLSFSLSGGGSPTCTYTLNTATQSAAATASSVTVNVTAGSGCTWTAASNASWITVSTGASGTSNGTVTLQIAANTGAARTGTVTIAGQTFTVNQAAAGGSGTVSSVYYRFENGTANGAATGSGSILDSLGTGQNGTPSGPVTYSSDVPLSTVGGATNKLSLQFAASGSVQFPAAFPLNSLTNATLEFYIKPASTGGEMDFLWTSTSSSDSNRFNMGVLGSGNTIFMDYREPNGTLHSLASITIAGSGWTHVAVVKSGNTWTSYANGVQQGQPVTDANPNLPTNTGWTLNGRNVNQFSGLLDELRISNTALTPAQFLAPVGAGACTYSLSATSASPGAASTTGTVNVTAATGCAWTAVSNASWITITSGASGTGNGTVNYSVAANTDGARTGTVTIAGQTFTVNQGAAGQPGCSYNVSPTDIHVTAAASSGTFLIVTNTTCSWTASVPSGVTWVTLNPTSGTGGGAVGYTIPANTGSARNTTLTIAGNAVTVEQDAASSCTYTLSSTSQHITGVGGSGAVTVTVTGTNCPAWTVSTPSVSWLHVTSPSGQTKTGLLTYSVDQNTGSSPRSTSLNIANQLYSITQDVAPCSYSLSAAGSPTIAATGGTGSVQVTVSGLVCSWAVALPTDTASQWVHVTSALNAAGSGTVNFAADVNTTTSPRSVTMTFIGQKPLTQISYTVSQAAGTANTGPVPVITPGGVVNAANYISANIPAGAIAQGSFFSIFGYGLGPDTPQKASSYPLGTTLGGVSIKVTQGSTSVAAIPVFAAAFQINAVMPSNAPTGNVQVTVSYNGNTSAPVQTQVAATNFSPFAVAAGRGPGIVQNYVSPTELPLNSSAVTAAPGDVVILWGTGLGPLPNGASDTQPPTAGSLPVTVQISLGGVAVQPLYSGRAPGLAGVDQINFQIPQNAPLGCYIPIQITAAGLSSNTVTMAIATNRQPCSDSTPIGSYSKTGGKNGTVVLSRVTLTDAGTPANSGTVDLAAAIFELQTAGGSLGFDPVSSPPPPNSCTYYNNVNAINGLFAGQLPSATNGQNLDAGASITVAGPNGARGLSYSDSTARTSPYFGLLGASGALASVGLTSDPLFLDPGAYTISGSGGKDVGPFSFPMNVSAGATWSNRDQISVIDRSTGLTINWSGGDATKQQGLILGLASNPSTNVSGAFACLVTFDQHSFTVPSSMMANLPGTAGSNAGSSESGLLFLTLPSAAQFIQFNTSAAPTLDNGTALFVTGDFRNNVTFK